MSRLRFVSVVLSLALLGAACGDDGGDTPGDGTPTTDAGSPTTTAASAETPNKGGTLTIGTFSETPGLDPLTNVGTGVNGGMELVALYDVLMTYDTETGEYVPRVAESLTPNDDQSVWTLKLRPGITFTDGTPYDAEAVVFNLQRTIDNKGRSLGLVSLMESFETPDDLTVIINLSAPSASIPFALSSAPGMIASPTAIAAGGEAFATNPVGAGAGPFMLKSYAAKEAVVLERNPDYWQGEVLLDELRFVNITGQQANFDALTTGTLQVSLLREAPVLAAAEEAGIGGLLAQQSAGNTITMNNGVSVTCNDGEPAPACTGQADGASVPTETATSEVKVRQAIAAAIDLDVLNERAYDGQANLSTALLSEGSRWNSDIAGPQYDLDAAKQLVAEAKADGWDGKLRVSCHNGLPSWGIAVKALLEQAGFEVDLRDQQPVADNITTVVVKKDFDIACFGVSILDEEPFSSLTREFSFTGYANPEVTAALQAGRVSTTEAETQKALDTIATVYAQEVPFLSIAPAVQLVALAPNVNGATQTVNSIAMFDQAWLS